MALAPLIQEARVLLEGGIILQRAGGLSPVKQTNKAAPEKHGVWAFIWPFADVSFLASTNPQGQSKEGGDTRLLQLKREGWRKFVHTGTIYTILPVPKALEVKGWYKTDADTLSAFVSKYVAQLHGQMRKMDPSRAHGQSPWSGPFQFSKGEFEVFVPTPGSGRVRRLTPPDAEED